jgi:hypothetical protein
MDWRGPISIDANIFHGKAWFKDSRVMVSVSPLSMMKIPKNSDMMLTSLKH